MPLDLSWNRALAPDLTNCAFLEAFMKHALEVCRSEQSYREESAIFPGLICFLYGMHLGVPPNTCLSAAENRFGVGFEV